MIQVRLRPEAPLDEIRRLICEAPTTTSYDPGLRIFITNDLALAIFAKVRWGADRKKGQSTVGKAGR